MYLACPHHWLLYRNRDACGIPDDLSYCARCLPETRGLDVAYLQTFRETVASRLDTVDHWVFASQSAVDFLLRVYDLDPARVVVIEHGAIIDHRRATREVDPGRVLDEPLRVGFVGIGWAKKGLPAVNELAEAFACSSIELHHFGELREAISPLVHTHGTYDNNVLPELLARAGIQVVLLPGPFVETFGHVMTESIVGGVPVIGNRTGALGERIRTHEVGWTVDPEDVDGMRELIENLDRCRPEVLRATTRAAEMELRAVEATADRYAALYLSRRHHGRAGPRERTSVNDDERLRRELRAMAAANRQLYAQLTQAKRAAAARPPSGGGAAAQARRVRRLVQQRGVGRAGRDAGQAILRRLRQVVGS
jgi:glycosyltransferase involved in cell wall biosynthesis